MPTPRPPLTEEQKQVLRDRLAAARIAKAAKSKEPKVAKEPAPRVATMVDAYAPWSEQQWQTASLDLCQQRLAQLKRDFETGSRMVGQRADQNDPRTYKCFVCGAAVPEVAPSGRGPGWVWKHDYLNPLTALYESVVICNQHCHTVYVNDTRLQQKLKDLMAGKVGSHAEEVPAIQ